jgi:mitochondrial fission protein ELM1
MPDSASVNETGDQGSPRIWMIVGDRLGDNAQVENLVAALEMPVERRYVKVRDPWNKGKPKVSASLFHIDIDASDPLEPPWPDLVITVGRRLSMVALWIQRESAGKTRLALVGKPSGSSDPFSLIVTSAEVQIAPGPNVLPISLPMLKVDEERIKAAADAWRDRLAPLPRPLIGILVGGPTNPFVFNRAVRQGLLETARDVVEKQGGTPYVTTSPRTPPKIVKALREGLPEQARFFEWKRGAEDNPYQALLGLADGFVATGDSISMLVEVVKLGKPLAIFPLPYGMIHKVDRIRRVGARWLYKPDEGSGVDKVRSAIRAVGKLLHILPRTRDFTAVHDLLIERGLAVRAGERLRPPTGQVPDDLPSVVARIRSLLGVEA